MRWIAITLLALVVAACGPTAVPTTTLRVTPAASVAPTIAATPVGSGAPSGAARPAFLTYAFTNVRDGSKFTLSDFAGKSVLVIGMAVW